MKLWKMTGLLILLSMFGCAGSGDKPEVELVFEKDGAYYLNSVVVKVSDSSKTEDDNGPFPTAAELSKKLEAELARMLKKDNRLATDPSSAQASLDIRVTYTRNFIVFTSRRMSPFMWYGIEAKKDGKTLGVFSSAKYTGKDSPFSKGTNADEYAYLKSMANKVVYKLRSSER
ncbi:MAG: hypothetical protein OEX03_11615 [Gammaproteobacteria bacterium]|nr:hypothetical protein [Gammaproteobacteria bacterium]